MPYACTREVIIMKIMTMSHILKVSSCPLVISLFTSPAPRVPMETLVCFLSL